MKLSEREIEILSVYATGRTKQQVGELLFITVNTVKTQLTRMQHHLGAVNLTEAVALAAPVLIDMHLPPAPGRCVRGPNDGGGATPLPPDLAERYPSTTWGVPEWYAVLQADNALYFSILRGIGKG